MDPNTNTTTDSASLQCTRCGKVKLADGREVWVCEDCGHVNQPVDATTAQAAVDQATADLAAPAAPVAAPAPSANQPMPVNPAQVQPAE